MRVIQSPLYLLRMPISEPRPHPFPLPAFTHMVCRLRSLMPVVSTMPKMGRRVLCWRTTSIRAMSLQRKVCLLLTPYAYWWWSIVGILLPVATIAESGTSAVCLLRCFDPHCAGTIWGAGLCAGNKQLFRLGSAPRKERHGMRGCPLGPRAARPNGPSVWQRPFLCLRQEGRRAYVWPVWS